MSGKTELEKIAAGTQTQRKHRAPKESEFITIVTQRLKKIGGNWEKRHGTAFGKAGQPDISGCVCGRRVEIEVKTGRNEPTDIQVQRLAEWSKAGAVCIVLWNAEPPRVATIRLMNRISDHGTSISILYGIDELETYVHEIMMERHKAER